MDADMLISVKGVSKKYCKSLKRSMLYGLRDITDDLLSRSKADDSLRPDEFWSVKDVSFDVREGECLGIVGANGAGKSSLLKMISGIYHPDKGEVTRVSDIGALIEVGAGFHPMLTGRENIFINASILGCTKQQVLEKFDEIVAFSELENFIDMPVKNYSSGMHVRLGFSVAVCLCPSALLLDEVLAVGDIKFSQKCFAKIRNLLNDGVGVVLVSHSINDLLRITSRLLVMDGGQLIFDGNPEQGIVEYQRCLALSNKKELGTEFVGDVKVYSGTESMQSECFSTFDDLWLEFTLKPSPHSQIEEIRVVVESPIYGPVAVINSSTSDVSVISASKAKRYALKIKKIPFLRGSYQLHMHFFSKDKNYQGGQTNIASIEIDSEKLGPAHRHLVALEREWYEK